MQTLFSFFNKIWNWLQKPAAFIEKKRDKWQFVGFSAIFTFVFLLVFQPFGVNNYDPSERIDPVFFFAVLLFGLVTGLTLAVNEFLIRPILFKSLFGFWSLWRKQSIFRLNKAQVRDRTRATKPGSATQDKQKSGVCSPITKVQTSSRLTNWGHLLLWALWTLVLLSSCIFLLYNALGDFHDWHWKSYFSFIGNIAYMMVLPFAIIYFYFRYRQMKSQYLEVIPAGGHLTDHLLQFFAENGKESLAIQSDQLVYIEAQENYIAIYYLQDRDLKKTLLRNSLKRLEQEYPDALLLRCHRSFMVNVNQISQIKTRYRQLTLLLQAGQIEIPVSRKYQPIVKSRLTIAHSSPRATNHPKAL